METCVLIPSEFSLVLIPSTTDANANRLYEMGVRIWSNQTVAKGRRFSPFQGTIRLDRLEVYSLLDDNDLRHRFGCYEEIQEVEDQKVRHCNWIRFLRFVTSPLSLDVNMVAVRSLDGDIFYETTRTVEPNTEMVVFYGDVSAADRLSPLTSTPVSSRYVNVTLWRQRIEDSPLDLSMSLVTTPPNNKSSSLRSSSTDVSSNWTNSSTSGSKINSRFLTLDKSTLPQSEPRKKARERTLLPCSYCGKAFDRPSLLRRHMRTHTGEKPHVCDVCGKGFSTSSSLNTHRRIHSGEKPHQCPVCGKRFTASSNLYYHRMTHNKEKPHKCGLCSKSFPTPGDLKSHMYVHSGTWPYKCHVCSRGFSKQTNLRNHLFLHTETPKEKCKGCKKEFPVGSGLINYGFCKDCGDYFKRQSISVSAPSSPETTAGTPRLEDTGT